MCILYTVLCFSSLFVLVMEFALFEIGNAKERATKNCAKTLLTGCVISAFMRDWRRRLESEMCTLAISSPMSKDDRSMVPDHGFDDRKLGQEAHRH